MSADPVRILLVEDSPSDAELLQAVLDESAPGRFHFEVAETLQAGVGRIEHQKFDVLLLDLSLPDSTGPGTFIRARASAPRLPIIVLTGLDNEALGTEAVRYGIQDYLIKGQTDGRQIARAIRYAIERKQAEEALRESEVRFRRLTEANIIGVIVVELNQIVEANDIFLEMVGRTRDDLKQGGIDWLRITPQKYEAEDRQAIEQLLDNGAWTPYEKEFHGRHGRPVPVLIGGSLLAHDPLSWIGFVLDMTRVKQAEESLQVANEELQVTNEELRAANELLEQRVAERTVELQQRSRQLQALTAELAQAEERERRRVAHVLHDHLQQLLVGARCHLETLRNSIRSASARADLKRVEELLAAAFETSRTLTYELSPPVLYEFGLAAAVEWLARWYESKHGLKVVTNTDPEVFVEEENLRTTLFQAARELLFNVVKHAKVKSARIELTATNERVHLTVSDAGAGFDPEQVFSGREVQRGFGLFSLRERLELLGAQFTMKSSPGAGSHFSICAPRSGAFAAQTAPQDRRATPPAAARSAIGRPPSVPLDARIRVLLVDDHRVMREGLTQVLERESDFEVIGEAADGQMAVDMARHLKPDVVLMDVSMPRLTGVQATRQITSELPQVRVIGLSMFEDDGHAGAMRKAGAVAFLSKSGPTANVVSAIRQHGARKAPPARKAGARAVPPAQDLRSQTAPGA